MSKSGSPFKKFVKASNIELKLCLTILSLRIPYSRLKNFQSSAYLKEAIPAAYSEPADDPTRILGNKSYSYKALKSPT